MLCDFLNNIYALNGHPHSIMAWKIVQSGKGWMKISFYRITSWGVYHEASFEKWNTSTALIKMVVIHNWLQHRYTFFDRKSEAPKENIPWQLACKYLFEQVCIWLKICHQQT